MHFGVYGVAISHDEILVVHKKTGPYKNRFDLPGGSRKDNELLIETLKREVLEETGMEVKDIKNCETFDFHVFPNDSTSFIHIAVIYYITLSGKEPKRVDEIVDNVENDSYGYEFIKINSINIDNASPLLLKIKEIYFGNINYNTTIYRNWIVNETSINESK